MKRKTAIFHLAGGRDDSPHRPIYEYVRSLVAAQRRHSRPDVAVEFLTFDNFDWRGGEAALASEVRRQARCLGARPVILLHTVLPFVGGVVSPELLEGFPSVVFPHQFKLLPEADRRRTFEYVRRADRCLVTTPLEVDQADALARETGMSRPARIAERFTTVGQPPSILPKDLRPAKDGDIAVFGMIRRGKGLGHVLSLAEHLRTDRRLAGKTIHLIGHVAERRDSVTLFKRLIARIYGIGREVRHRGRTLAELSLKETVELLRELKARDETRFPGARRLPVELHVSLPGAAVSALLGRCTYGYLPVVGGELERAPETYGLTKHSSAAPTLAAHRMVLLAPIGSLTPDELRRGEVVDVKDATEAAAAIRRLDRDPARREVHVARSYRWSRSDTWDDVAASVNEVCRAAAWP